MCANVLACDAQMNVLACANVLACSTQNNVLACTTQMNVLACATQMNVLGCTTQMNAPPFHPSSYEHKTVIQLCSYTNLKVHVMHGCEVLL